MRAALRRDGGRALPALPTATRPTVTIQHLKSHSTEAPTHLWLDLSGQAKHHLIDPRKQTPGGRHQIGTPAGFKSESVADFRLECVAGFVGIHTRCLRGDAVAPVVALQAQSQAAKGRELSTLAPLRALRARTPEPAWGRRAGD